MPSTRELHDPNILARVVGTGKAGENPYTLLLGAGASQSSGIPTVHAMVGRWKGELLARLQASAPTSKETAEEIYLRWRRDHTDAEESDYGALFSYFYRHPAERQRFIEAMIDGKKPTLGYLYFAGLVAARRFNRILTTNFDDLIADALVWFYDTRPIVCAFDSAVSSIRMASLRPKVIKLHGDFLYDSIRSTGDEVKRLGANMEDKLLEACKDCGLIVVGYAGHDESVMGAIHYMLRKGNHLKMGLHWCVHQGAQDEVSPRLNDLLRIYGSQIRLYAIDGFDGLMCDMFKACECSHPEVLLQPDRKSVYKELRTAIENTSSVLPRPEMQADLDMFLERASNREPELELEVYLADSDHAKAVQALKLDDLEAAERLFTSSAERVEKVLADESLPSGVQARALRRSTGAYVGLAEVHLRNRQSDWAMMLVRTLSAATMGHNLCLRVGNVPAPLQRTFNYNALCAYALKLSSGQALTDDECREAKQQLEWLAQLDPEATDRAELAQETGGAELMRLLGPRSSKETNTPEGSAR